MVTIALPSPTPSPSLEQRNITHQAIDTGINLFQWGRAVEFLANLNKAQLHAALAPPGPWLVLAGPGTGKTRTLVARIQSLVEHYKIRPDHLLAVTYTNKATEEMRERLQLALGRRAMTVQVSTFHSFCITVLREYHEKAGLAKHFTIADEDCQLRAMARIAPMLAGERHIRFALGRISGARLNPGECRPLSALEEQIKKRYETELRKNSLIDFDDILFLTQRLFFEHPEILNRYRHTFDAILVDEFQDTDRVQYEIIKMLVNEHGNLFVVADDDQSIFSWRGANPCNIELFRRDFARDHVIVLTENYRSRPEILEQAQMLISQNPRLTEKQLQPIRRDLHSEQSPVRVEQFPTDCDEANFIISEVRNQMAKDSALQYSDFAVLYARHSVGEFLERELMKADLPCQLVRGRSCFDRPEIVRAIHLLRVLHNPKDQFSLEEFIAREVDEVTLARLKTLQREEGISEFRVMLDRFRKRSWVPEQERRQIERLIGLISNLISFKNSAHRLTDLFAEILNSLSHQEVLTLAGHAEHLTDAIFYHRMRDAAKAIVEARNAQRTVLLSASHPALAHIGIEILKRALGICVSAANAYIAEQIANRNDDAEKKNFPAPLKPVLIMLDGEELPMLGSADNYQAIIYLGIDYGPWMREQLHAINAIVLNPEDLSALERGFEPSSIALLFKLCQAVTGLSTAEFYSDYVALDIETTDRDVEINDIIELAAVRVRNGIPAEHYHTLIKPCRPISPDAAKVHGFNDADLANAPAFAEISNDFLSFIGQDALIAHNGYNFDFPCIKRKLREQKLKLENRIFDTLPMAARLYPDRGASLDALASLFDIDTGQRHRAYDDTQTLIEIFERLKKEHASRLRRTACEQCLDLVAAGIIIEQGRLADAKAILIKEGLARLAAHGSTLIERLAENFSEEIRDLTLLRGMAEEAKAEQIRNGAGSADRFSAFLHFDEIVSRFDMGKYACLTDSIEAFLDFAALYQQQDGINRRNAINLMTIYASKGLEFNRVFIAGLEQNIIPSFYAIGSKSPEQLAEQRRLLYVAITRAKEQLIFTTAATRNGYPQVASEFLSELPLK
jgi:DNA polymerase III epsilon subunit family exonuclease